MPRNPAPLLLSASVLGATAFMRFHLLADLWGTVLILATVAVALSLLTGLSGQVSLGHAALMGVGAYTSGVLAARSGLPIVLCVVAGVAAAAVAGLLLGAPALRIRGQFLALVTIAGGYIFLRVVSELEGTGGDSGLVDVPSISILGTELIPADYVWVAAAVFCLLLIGADNLKRSRIGRSLAAVKDSEVTAAVSGVGVFGAKLWVFCLSAGMCGLAGAVFAHKEGFLAPPFFDLNLSLALIAACILGGISSPTGSGAAAIMLLAPPLILPFVDRRELLYLGPLALAALFFMPDGIAGVARRKGRNGLGSLQPNWKKTEEKDPAPDAHTPASASGLLTIEGLSKSFGEVRALSEVSLKVTPGEIHALIGPNGSGKTTLVDCVTAVLKPDAGTVGIDGRSLSGLPPHLVAGAGVGRTFQSIHTMPSFSVLELAALGAVRESPASPIACVLRLPSSRAHDRGAQRRAAEALAAVGLEDRSAEGAASLSYGQLRRLDIARALAGEPRFLILDEPAAGRNEQEVKELVQLLRRLAACGVGILLVDHHVELVMSVSDRVTVLDEGRTIATGTPDEVRLNSRVVDAYLGSPDETEQQTR
ncbi:MAG TPA: branched-chain amino acid ABC transporter ATP-binding protein/permease [Actinomycetota bacterium]|nr:branched-chain amino acid ABC transporter ATP-binding protein/permease [Actinomycetota bacterium]